MRDDTVAGLAGPSFDDAISTWDDYYLHKVLLAIKRERPAAWPSPQPGEAERTGTPPYLLDDR